MRAFVPASLRPSTTRRRGWARGCGRASTRRDLVRQHVEAVEDEVRSHIALFQAQTQPAELAAQEKEDDREDIRWANIVLAELLNGRLTPPLQAELRSNRSGKYTVQATRLSYSRAR